MGPCVSNMDICYAFVTGLLHVCDGSVHQWRVNITFASATSMVTAFLFLLSCTLPCLSYCRLLLAVLSM